MRAAARIKMALVAIGVPLLLTGSFAWMTWRRFEQAKMDAPLIRAVRSHDVGAVRNLLDKGADANARDRPPKRSTIWETARGMLRQSAQDRGENFKSALMIAARHGEPAILRLLIERGAQVDARGPGRTTSLLEAAAGSSIPSLELLLDRGAQVSATNQAGQDAVLIAVKEKFEDCAQLLLRRGGGGRALESGNRTAMSYAIENALSTVYQPLLKAGANPDDEDPYGTSALENAISQGDLSIVNLLLRHQASPNRRGTSADEAPLAQAYNWVRNSWGGEEPEAKRARRQIVQTLLDSKADPNLCDASGQALLFRAMRDGEGSIVNALVAAGADPNLREKGNPAIVEAVTQRMPSVVNLLLDRRADVNAQDPVGTTALMVAAFNGDADIVKVLLERGANAKLRDTSGSDAAYFARESPRVQPLLRSAQANTTYRGGPQVR